MGLVTQARRRGARTTCSSSSRASGCRSTRRPGSSPRRREDLAGDKRRLFVARAAANDWDAVIMTRTAFERIAVSPEIEATLHRRRARRAPRSHSTSSRSDDHARSSGSRRRSLRPRRRTRRALDDRRATRASRSRPPGCRLPRSSTRRTTYKNLATPSNIQDAAIAGSQRATDLHMKLEYLRQRHGDRVATIATATPLANSVTEAYVMQRYLRPDLLEQAGVMHFDAWAATFGSHGHRDGDGSPAAGVQTEDPVRAVPERPRDAAHVARRSRT